MKKFFATASAVLLCVCVLCSCGSENHSVYTYNSQDGTKTQSFTYDKDGALIGLLQTIYFESDEVAEKFAELYDSENNSNSVEDAVSHGSSVTITYKRSYLDSAYTAYTIDKVDELMTTSGWLKK